MFLVSIKFSRKQYFWRCFFISLLSTFVTKAYSEENNLPAVISVSGAMTLSAGELFEQAKSVDRSKHATRVELANRALLSSQQTDDQQLTARLHVFLGKEAQQTRDIEAANHHFLQASNVYKDLADKVNYLLSSVEYADSFIDKKAYSEADKVLAELLPMALELGAPLSVAEVHMAQAESYYKQKRFSEAILHFSDALKYLSDQSPATIKKRGQSYKMLAQSYKRLKNRELTASFYKKALEVYTALEDRKLMARTLNTLAEAERYLGNYTIALDFSNRSLELHQTLDDPEGRAKALMGAGIIYRHIGRYEMSVKHVNEAFNYYKSVNNSLGIAKTANQMGLLFTKLKLFSDAREFYQITIEQPESEIDLDGLATASREIAVIDLSAGNYAVAKVMAEKALKIYRSENEKAKQSLAVRILGNIYKAENNHQKAIESYQESLAIATEIGSKIYQIKAQIQFAEILVGKDDEQAIELLKASLQLSDEINNNNQKLYAYRLLRKAEKSRGDIAGSLAYAEDEIAMTLAIQEEDEYNELVLEKAKLYSHQMGEELLSLREKSKLDQLELDKQSNEIEIVSQAARISELELAKNRYTNIALASLLAVCILVVLFIYRRFIKSKRLNKDLDYLAARDPLTHCYNRRVLFEILSRDLSNIELLGEYSIIMADIDHFKQVNDVHRHSGGDAALCGVAKILKDGVRQNDIVARFGGEEFCIILPGSGQEQAMRLSENMRKKIEASRFEGIAVTCSFGVTSISFNATSPNDLIDQADLALYHSKRQGRNQVTLWHSSLE